MSAEAARNLDDIALLVERWSSDAVTFVRDMFGVEPSSQQAALLSAASAPGAHVAAKSGHGTGKSTADAWLMLWGLVCFGDDVKIPCTAPTKHQLEDVLWPEARKWQAGMLEPWKSAVRITSDKISVEGLPGYAAARTARKDNPEALQGFHAGEMLFVIDEASGIDDRIFEVARGALSTPNARVVMTSNPTRTTGFFYRAFHIHRDRWKTLTFSCEDSPMVSPEYVKEMEDEYGRESDIFRVRVLGEFPSGGDLQFIAAAAAEAAMERSYPDSVYAKSPRVLGVDVAAYGGDRNVIVERQGLFAHILWQARECETATVAGEVARLWKERKCQAAFVDAAGVGFGVASNLRDLGFSPFAVQFGAAASDTRQFKNKRAECWSLMKDWIAKDGGWLNGGEFAEHIKDDLTGPDYQFDMQGRLQLERKEDMRKRGVSSPDFADALALTFALPVAPAAAAADWNRPLGAM
jgi:hypothetical protein